MRSGILLDVDLDNFAIHWSAPSFQGPFVETVKNNFQIEERANQLQGAILYP